MPYKSQRRRAPRKPTMRKAKQMVTRLHKKKAKKNMDTFFLKAKVNALLTPKQGTTVTNYIQAWLPLLDRTVSQTTLLGQNEFILYRTMYDRVRINSIKVTVTPKANVLDMAVAQQDAQYSLTGDGMIHTCIDRDDQPSSNINRISRYPSYRKYRLTKAFSRSYSIKYPTGIWLDCQNISSEIDMYRKLGLDGGIFMYAEDVIEDKLELINEPWADVTIEYNCVFQGKTSAGLSYNEDTGEVTVTPDVPYLLPNTLTTVRGTIRSQYVDPSGNLVPDNDQRQPE